MICFCPSAPQKMGVFWITVLFWNLPLSFVLSQGICDTDTHYQWPYETPKWCCSKCKPGEFMKSRCKDASTDTVCMECSKGMYTVGYQVLSRCERCSDCKENEREKRPCTTKQNRLCECKPGYERYQDNSECEEKRREVTTTATSTTTQAQRPTTTKQLPKLTPKNVQQQSYDAVLLPAVLIVCMCILLLIIATKLRKLETCGCCLIDDSTSSKDTQSTEEEALPVQEVCSHLQEEWRKDGFESIIQ